MRYPVPAALGALFLLTACMAEVSPPAAVAPEDACGASALQDLLGQPVAGQDFGTRAAAQRVMADGSAMTMDYRADRLNVTYDTGNRITRIWCG